MRVQLDRIWDIGKLNECNLPPNNDWSIHGLWPSRDQVCDTSKSFSLEALEPVRSELEVKWIDVHKGQKVGKFWEHEWNKHGRCFSADTESTNTQLKYFKKGLDLFKQYNAKNILAKSGVYPGEQHDLEDYIQSFERILGTDSFIFCKRNSVSTCPRKIN